MIDLALVKADLVRDEGVRLKLYLDTVGKATIGIGRNLTDRGITANEAEYLLGNDLSVAQSDLDAHLPEWRAWPDAVQRGILNLCFNLGWPKLSNFANMLAALKRGDYQAAAAEALDSAWAGQVGERATRIAQLFRGA